MGLIAVLGPQCRAGMVIFGAGRARLRRGEALRFVVSCRGESAGPLSEALRRSDGEAGHKGIKTARGRAVDIKGWPWASVFIGQVGVKAYHVITQPLVNFFDAALQGVSSLRTKTRAAFSTSPNPPVFVGIIPISCGGTR